MPNIHWEAVERKIIMHRAVEVVQILQRRACPSIKRAVLNVLEKTSVV
jgi:hypothetical protein